MCDFRDCLTASVHKNWKSLFSVYTRVVNASSLLLNFFHQRPLLRSVNTRVRFTEIRNSNLLEITSLKEFEAKCGSGFISRDCCEETRYIQARVIVFFSMLHCYRKFLYLSPKFFPSSLINPVTFDTVFQKFRMRIVHLLWYHIVITMYKLSSVAIYSAV